MRIVIGLAVAFVVGVIALPKTAFATCADGTVPGCGPCQLNGTRDCWRCGYEHYTQTCTPIGAYYIDETTDFTGNGCEIADVNEITASLQSALNSRYNGGQRFVNGNAWPQDFIESCSSSYGTSGLDGTYADNSNSTAPLLTVFAGHGGPAVLSFGYIRNGVCDVSLTNNVRLGQMSGGKSGFGMWLACSVLQSSTLSTNMYQRERQQAGFQNCVAIGNDEPRDFFNATANMSSKDAWLQIMSSGGRDAIFASFDAYGSTGCNNSLNSLRLYNGPPTPLESSPMCGQSQTWYYSCYERRQN